MKKVNDILRENQSLKEELDGIIQLVRENEVKHRGFKVVEYSVLMAESLQEMEEKPLHYLKEIFSIEYAAIFLDEEKLKYLSEDRALVNSINFVRPKVFRYFFLEKRPYMDTNRTNLITEFDIFSEMGSYLISPILENGKIIGSLNLYSKSSKRFGSNLSPDFIKDLCFKISIALRKMDNSKQISVQSLIDDATGLYNKKAMYRLIDTYISRFQRYKNKFSFVFFDLNKFKLINDNLGHFTGDQILQKIGKSLSEEFRKSDHVGRFGGDEFFIITQTTTKRGLKKIGNRIIEIIGSIEAEFGLDNSYGVSGGIVFVPADIKSKVIDSEYIMRLADERLYNAKKVGGSCFL